MEYNPTEERWVPIKGYEDHYLISDFGRIKSIDRYLPMKWGSGDKIRFHKGKIKEATPHYKNKYLSVMLKVNSIESRRFIHRLVAEHFHENPENKPEVNHKDGNKNNNHFSNLEWATPLENTQHAIQTGLSKKSIPVILVKDCAIIEFKSRTECGEYLDVWNSWIGQAIKKKFTIRGYHIYDL